MALANEELRDQIREVLPEAIEALSAIIRNPNTRATARIKAFEALANRGGLPAITANVSQSISASVNPKELLEAKAELLREQEEISAQMRSLRVQIGDGKVREAREAHHKILPQPKDE